MKVLFTALSAAIVIAAGTAQATTITYSATDVSGSTWQYDYIISNNTPADPIHEFTIFFTLGEFSNLQVQSSPGNWNSVVAQPDPSIPADGFFDSLALDSGLQVGAFQNGFAVQFTWLGQGTPRSQLFNVVDPNTFITLEAGTTVPAAPVPLPSSAGLLLSALAIGAGLRGKSTLDTAEDPKKA